MIRCVRLGICLAGLGAAACAGPAVVGDSRGPFDTVSGVAGGNEFGPLSAEGKRTFAGQAPAPGAKSDAVAAAAAPSVASSAATGPAPVTAAASLPAPAPIVALGAPSGAVAAPAAVAAAPDVAPAPTTIVIDANAFSAVFAAAAGPIAPSGEQLMQLDSLSFVAAEPLRTELQRKILACRRAGAACRLAAH